jgi:hypothetical protein
MWKLVVLSAILILHDYMKAPIDRLYFQNPLRPLVGMRNTIVDLIDWHSQYHVKDYPGLWLVRLHYDKITQEFQEVSKSAKKHLFHELDPWFDKNPNYYCYKVEDFPLLKSLIDQIPCIHKETALFAVMEGPMSIAPHRAETNLLLRYHLTIESGGDCTLYTEKGAHKHREGEDFLFDHARIHSVDKHGIQRRVVLILDVKRF